MRHVEKSIECIFAWANFRDAPSVPGQSLNQIWSLAKWLSFNLIQNTTYRITTRKFLVLAASASYIKHIINDERGKSDINQSMFVLLMLNINFVFEDPINNYRRKENLIDIKQNILLVDELSLYKRHDSICAFQIQTMI